MIVNAFDGLELPVYSDGMQVRDWLYIDDHCRGILSEKLMRETCRSPVTDFETGLARTIGWYRANASWVALVRSGEYCAYYEAQNGARRVLQPSI